MTEVSQHFMNSVIGLDWTESLKNTNAKWLQGGEKWKIKSIKQFFSPDPI